MFKTAFQTTCAARGRRSLLIEKKKDEFQLKNTNGRYIDETVRNTAGPIRLPLKLALRQIKHASVKCILVTGPLKTK